MSEVHPGSRLLKIGLALALLSVLAPMETDGQASAVGQDSVTQATGAVFPTDARVERISGRTRFGTAVAVSKLSHPHGADALVLATGRNWPDALGGAALAGATDAPVLLTEAASLPTGVLGEVDRLDPGKVFVLGGEAAIAPAVLDQLASVLPSATVTRIGGATRYGTATRVASMTIGAMGDTWDHHAFVVTGRNFADALSVGPVCVGMQDPLFLIGEDTFADPVILEMLALGVTDVTIVGGSGAVSATVAARLTEALGGTEHVDRIGGADRFGTAALLARFASDEAGFGWDGPGVATGFNYADAIAAGPMLGRGGSSLLLTGRNSVPASIASAIYENRGTIDEFTVFGGEGTVPEHVAQEAQHATLAPSFDVDRAMGHVAYLAGLGPRGAGSTAERKAFVYIEAELASYGYTTSRQSVRIPSGLGSYNVIAEKSGASGDVIVLGAHVDSKPPSPGGNDNASGVGVLLELARLLADAPTTPTVRFIAFGAEEISGATADDHHFGSRQYVDSLTAAERARVHGMVSIDMVGYGDTFNIRHMGVGTFSLIWALQARGGFVSEPLYYLRDPGRYGWSDHEGFEFAGMPAAWLEWRDDPDYHTVRDTASHVDQARIRSTGRLLRGWLLAMTQSELDSLR